MRSDNELTLQGQTYSLKGQGGGVRWTPPQDFRYVWTDRLEIWHEC